MPLEMWSDNIVVARLTDDPQFTEDLHALECTPAYAGAHAVLDFSCVQLINSSNLSALLRARKRCVESTTRLILCNLPTQAWGTFLVTGLDKVFEFSDDVSTALTTLQMAKAR